MDKDTTTYNVYRASAFLEVGYTFNNYISLLAGGGYQYSYTKNPYTTNEQSKAFDRYENVDSFAVYIQAPINVNEYISFAPQVTSTQTSANNRFGTDLYTSLLASLQMNVKF